VRPGTASVATVPACSSVMTRHTVFMPSPVPYLCGLVVKNSSKEDACQVPGEHPLSVVLDLDDGLVAAMAGSNSDSAGTVHGTDLSRRATAQAPRFGAELLLTEEVTSIEHHVGVLGVTFSDGREVRAHSVIISTGVSYRRLQASGAAALTGRGIYYGAAISEAGSVRGEAVQIVGAANSAGQAAICLAKVARHVTMLVCGAELSSSMSHYLAERIEATPNVDLRLHTTVDAVSGSDRLEGIVLRVTVSGKQHVTPACALFVFIGAQP
jgi:thioredoxin reductase (NADPH)